MATAGADIVLPRCRVGQGRARGNRGGGGRVGGEAGPPVSHRLRGPANPRPAHSSTITPLASRRPLLLRRPSASSSGIAALLLPALACSSSTPAPGGPTPAATSPAITPGDLRARLSIFADDSMQGRKAGTPGNVRRTDYIAAEASAHRPPAGGRQRRVLPDHPAGGALAGVRRQRPGGRRVVRRRGPTSTPATRGRAPARSTASGWWTAAP